MKKTFIITALFSLILSAAVFAQADGSHSFMAANWNVENLFDTTDDPAKDDAEFLPSGEKKWDSGKFDTKLLNLSKVIRSMNQGSGPDLLGVEEVENQPTLELLLRRHFSDKNYKVAYAESPDGRGIDVGLIYNASVFTLKNSTADTVKIDGPYPTRSILHATLSYGKQGTLHVFVNHWPSRRSGQDESEKNRMAAATVLRTSVDKILSADPEADIIIMGDFNDEPSNTSITSVLKARDFSCDSLNNLESSSLFNLSYKKHMMKEGTYFYKDNYNMLDQIIVSKGLLEGQYNCGSFEVYKPEFSQTRNGKFKGAIFPTYGGRNYLGGYSDHYPVTAVFGIQ